jgi:hypothetical protein
MSRWGRIDGNFPVFAVGAILACVLVVTITVTVFLDITISIIRAAGTVTVSSLVVSVAVTAVTIILARGIITTTATTGRRRSSRSTRRTTRWSTLTISASVEAPGSRRRCASPLDFQDVVPAKALVVHLMVGIIRITSILILHEGESETTGSSTGSRNVTADKSTIAFEFVG